MQVANPLINFMLRGVERRKELETVTADQW